MAGIPALSQLLGRKIDIPSFLSGKADLWRQVLIYGSRCEWKAQSTF